jgi:hypothetical protein
MDKGKGMTPDEYINNANRTNAPTDKAKERFDKLNHDDLKKLMIDYIEICKKLDLVKKAVFYGKNFQESPVGQDETVMKNIDVANMDVFHGVIGLATESGEMFEAMLKFMNGETLDAVNVMEENGDFEWYQHLLFKFFKTSMESVWEKNIAKLKARYPQKFTEECAINRNLNVERKILEG